MPAIIKRWPLLDEVAVLAMTAGAISGLPAAVSNFASSAICSSGVESSVELSLPEFSGSIAAIAKVPASSFSLQTSSPLSPRQRAQSFCAIIERP
ncbi:MAG: hypothetical protein ISR45_09545 [Rhodospirillales bacterium]|nr:hypothetical protein [Rhodospirillales bacterium]